MCKTRFALQFSLISPSAAGYYAQRVVAKAIFIDRYLPPLHSSTSFLLNSSEAGWENAWLLCFRSEQHLAFPQQVGRGRVCCWMQEPSPEAQTTSYCCCLRHCTFLLTMALCQALIKTLQCVRELTLHCTYLLQKHQGISIFLLKIPEQLSCYQCCTVSKPLTFLPHRFHKWRWINEVVGTMTFSTVPKSEYAFHLH